jgi:RNA polymerase sigma-70 factor (ECF subfamily)
MASKVVGEEPSDGMLLTASVGDVDRFGELYDRHVDAVLAFHQRRTGSAHTAADLTAETFAEAFTSRHRFRDTGAPARAWLFAIARRQLARYIRREKVATRARRQLGMPVEVTLDDADRERIEQLADMAPLRLALEEALAALSPAQAQAVTLRVGHDLAYDEIASRLGCSEGAARVRVSRALTRLADEMEGRR